MPVRHQLDYLSEHVRHSLGDKGRSVLLVTANQSARRLWDYFAALGMPVERLFIVDVVSSPLLAEARADSTRCLYLGNPMALETLIARCDRIARTQLPKPVHTIVHNLNAFCLYNGSEVLEEAIRRVVRDVADPDALVDFVIEEGVGVYTDLEKYLQNAADWRKNLGPRMVPSGDSKAKPPEHQRR